MKLKKLTLALFAGSALALTGCVEDGKDGVAGVAGTDASDQFITLEQVARTNSQGFDQSAAEIVSYDKKNNRIYTINSDSGEVDVFNNLGSTMSKDPDQTLNMATLISGFNSAIVANTIGEPNSIDVSGDYAAVAVANADKTEKGWVVFLNTSDYSVAGVVEVGALPDMVTFTPDGKKALVANEGEPSDDYSKDPDGTVSVITIADFSVVHVEFLESDVVDISKMIIDGYSATNEGNKATFAQMIEPEYITVAEDGSKAFVALQENNAIAVIDLTDNSVEKIFGLGFKDHGIVGNEIDASDKDDGPNLKNWPIMGMYMPDAIASFTFNDKTFVVTANEGDSRSDWLKNVSDKTKCETAGYWFDGADGSGECVDEMRVKNLNEDGGLTLGGALLELDKADGTVDGVISDDRIGRLEVSYHATRVMNGNDRADGTVKTESIEKVYAYGARSFAIYDVDTGLQVFDSGSDFERITANIYGAEFNQSNSSNKAESRSDAKGPEPEGIAVGKVNGKTYAFIGLERMGGIMVYDVSNPYAPEYIQYVNNRNVNTEDYDIGDLWDEVKDGDKTEEELFNEVNALNLGDLGPEGFKFVPAVDSPDGKDYLIVGSEVSGTTTVYEVKKNMVDAE